MTSVNAVLFAHPRQRRISGEFTPNTHVAPGPLTLWEVGAGGAAPRPVSLPEKPEKVTEHILSVEKYAPPGDLRNGLRRSNSRAPQKGGDRGVKRVLKQTKSGLGMRGRNKVAPGTADPDHHTRLVEGMQREEGAAVRIQARARGNQRRTHRTSMAYSGHSK